MNKFNFILFSILLALMLVVHSYNNIISTNILEHTIQITMDYASGNHKYKTKII